MFLDCLGSERLQKLNYKLRCLSKSIISFQSNNIFPWTTNPLQGVLYNFPSFSIQLFHILLIGNEQCKNSEDSSQVLAFEYFMIWQSWELLTKFATYVFDWQIQWYCKNWKGNDTITFKSNNISVKLHSALLK